MRGRGNCGCSVGRLQGHTRRGLIDVPKQRLGSKFYYSEEQAEEIKVFREPQAMAAARREGR